MKLLRSPFQALNYAGLVCAYSSRDAGNMSLSYGDTSRALENRKGFLSTLSIDYRDLICAKQVHGNSVRYVNETDKTSGALSYENSIPDTDGFITDVRGLPLAIFTADCLSIFLYDPKKPAIGLIHAGWRSSKENIVRKAFGFMRERFNTRADELCVGFGPSLRSCCYEVGDEFRGYFSEGLIEKEKHLRLDLITVNKRQLCALEVKEENIFDSGFCTSCSNEDFFSFRREGKACGRMLSVIMLK